jgi:hypothetical protein
MVSKCEVCQELRSQPAKADVHPWVCPSTPWSRIHVDFPGQVSGHTYPVIVDAYSKFPEIVKMTNITSSATIKVLCDMFSCYGVPKTVLSDNGRQLVSQEFEQLCAMNGIVHRTSAVFKTSNNGRAERVVQILKTAIKQAELSNEDTDSYIQRYLLRYRITPHSPTGESPSTLLMGRRLRTRSDLVLPSSTTKLVRNRQELKLSSDLDARKFTVGDKDSVRNFVGSRKCISGSVVSVLGTRHYLVDVGNGTIWKRHVDQMIKSTQSTTVSVDVEPEHSVIHSEGAAPVNVDIDAAPSPNIKILYRQSVKTLMLYLKRQLNIMKQ